MKFDEVRNSKMIKIQDIQFQRRSRRITLAKRGGILVGF
ncbi:FIG00746189: hypothetical protein [Limosilactobacillus reuteri]|uniref:Uncharacterized protein n=1 Tax=Limosilactobacillus reuteri TaxID=1598 RepID=A0A0U5JRS3_LIMRT|nr:FIG00746189: hypothetical protein [Limosilactobacillus reuteri subsp. porcinus]CUR41414.1 FIG00746189: hypothetical protein [Limosilactobacillus reuteri]